MRSDVFSLVRMMCYQHSDNGCVGVFCVQSPWPITRCSYKNIFFPCVSNHAQTQIRAHHWIDCLSTVVLFIPKTSLGYMDERWEKGIL